MSTRPLQPAIFLDRDGVIIENKPDYVRAVSEVKFLPGALEALARLAAREWRVVIVTNQSGIGRGLVTREAVDLINTYILERITTSGGRVDGLYLCPHHPQAGCACRKPAPGMLLAAADDLGLDLTASVLIGDAPSDLQAARAAGVRPILVLSGVTSSEEEASGQFDHTSVVQNLAEAVAQLLETRFL
jgi:D-glycero-D-manno-heptose 1,7-bisphosphate phosphatase